MIRATSLSLLLFVTLFANAAPEFSQKDLNEELVVAANWQQLAPEYDALMYQGYNIATDNLRTALTQLPKGSKPAIVIDIDDTLVDGITYFTSLIGTDQKRTAERSAQWWTHEPMTPLPGAIEFLREAHQLNVDIFYISGRFNSVKSATLKHLRSAGFPVKNESHLIFQDKSNTTISKEARRQQIRDKGFHIVMLLGDQLDDLAEVKGALSHQKRQWVAANKDHFGQDWYLFPNTIYGSWEGAVSENFKKLSKQEQHDAKIAALSQTHYHEITDPEYARQLMQASIWTNTSADFEAISYQTYNHAGKLLSQISLDSIDNPAIILDIDGTLVNFTPKRPNLTQEPEENLKNPYAWFLKNHPKAKPIPGALEFTQQAKQSGIEIFYVTARNQSSTTEQTNDVESSTALHLQKLGFPNADPQHILLKGEYCEGDKNKACTKPHQRKAITEGKVDGKRYQVLMYFGDYMHDFDLAEQGLDPNSKDSVSATRELFGRQYFILPCPMNTSRMIATLSLLNKKSVRELSTKEQAQLRRNVIKDWTNKPGQ